MKSDVYFTFYDFCKTFSYKLNMLLLFRIAKEAILASHRFKSFHETKNLKVTISPIHRDAFQAV